MRPLNSNIPSVVTTYEHRDHKRATSMGVLLLGPAVHAIYAFKGLPATSP
jgi:hypothetical protein